MYLKHIAIQSFRSCIDTTVTFQPGLTVLVGPNDAGKSNIIDAIRLSLPAASGTAAIAYDVDTDPPFSTHTGTHSRVIRIYDDLTTYEQALYFAALVDHTNQLTHITEFASDRAIHPRHRTIHYIGKRKQSDPEPELRQRIAHVYLPPLRDAAAILGSTQGKRMAAMIDMLASEEAKTALHAIATSSVDELASAEAVQLIESTIQDALSEVTGAIRQHHVSVVGRPTTLLHIARSLHLRLSAAGLTAHDITQSGLGYANLLYIATVMLELSALPSFDLVVLLVEEPEAHLHPQLQRVLLSFLQDQVLHHNATATPRNPLHNGHLQVIITTHSPDLASAVSITTLTHVRSIMHSESPRLPVQEQLQGDQKALPSTQTISFSTLPLSITDIRKLDRYIDATRSSLLFSSRVILVEGISEMLLLPSIAMRVLDADDKKRIFRGTTIVPIHGVDFEPYLHLLIPDDRNSYIIPDRIALITDADGGKGMGRERQIASSFPNAYASQQLRVFISSSTLESSLYGFEQNDALLKKAYLNQHPRSLGRWSNIFTVGSLVTPTRESAFAHALKSSDFISKGRFAQDLSDLISLTPESDPFYVPEYLSNAVHFVTEPAQ